MSRARILAGLSALSLTLGLGVVAGPAGAAPQLSTGCAQVHSYLGHTFGSSVSVNFAPAAYAAGEELVIVGFASTGSLDVAVGLPNGQKLHFDGGSGQKILIPVTVSASYSFTLSSVVVTGPPAYATWTADCGVPPTPVIASPADGQTFTIGQNVPTSFSCTQQTNPVAGCVESGNMPGASGALDTSTLGQHTYTVTATDSSGLLQKASISYTVVKKPQTISFTSAAPTDASYDGTTYTAAATATSGLPVTFTSGTPAVCTVNGGAVSFVGVGTCTIDADQAGDGTWATAATVTQSFAVAKAPVIVGAYTASKGLLGLTSTTFQGILARHWYPNAGFAGPITGQQLVFSVAGKTVCTATTGTDGTATCKATIGLVNALNQKQYQVAFAGSAFYDPATASGELK